MSALLRTIAIKGWQFLRAFWMIIGISIGIFLFMESCDRLQETTRYKVGDAVSGIRNRGAPAKPVARNPMEKEPWYSQYLTEFLATANQGWRPYVYFRRAHASHGQLVSVDSQLHRVTPQPLTPAQPLGRVFFFGGSTMWGSNLRDDHTI